MQLYETTIRHTRKQPPERSFAHDFYTWLVELHSVPEDTRGPRRFDPRDHLGDSGTSIRRNLQRWLITKDIDLGDGAVWMLAQARVLGYVFNPLSVYWCYYPDGTAACTVAEVHNTYGEGHRYLLLPDTEGYDEVDKNFYVSPFLPQQGRYRLWLPPPGDELALRIELTVAGETVFTATMTGSRRNTTRGRMLLTQLRHPLMPQRVATWIRGHGIALWLRRAPRVPHRSRPHREESA